MKATQVRKLVDNDGKSLRSFICVTCNTKTTMPYGFVQHGKRCVCSRKCEVKYTKRKIQEATS